MSQRPHSVQESNTQLLPLLELSECQVACKQPVKQTQRGELAPINLAQELELVDRGVAALARAFVEMTGLGTHPAVQAGLQIERDLLRRSSR